MLGVTYFRGKLFKQALGSGKLQLKDVDDYVRRVLKLVKKALLLGLPKNAEEQTIDTPNIAALLWSLPVNSIVLLKNTNSVLSFRKNKTTAGIGSNARYAAYCCGGPASLRPYHHVEYALGPLAWKRLPLLSEISRTTDGQRAEEIAEYELSISVARTAKLFIDGKLVVDNETKQRPGESFFGQGTVEELGVVKLEKGKTYSVPVTFGSLPNMTFRSLVAVPFGAGGLRRGHAIADVIFGGITPAASRRSVSRIATRTIQLFLNFRFKRQRTLYREDVYVGYRFYEKVAREVAFPFGHGLSYISFDIQDLKIAERTGANNEDEIYVTITVTNTGSVAGAYVAQVHVPQHNRSVNRPLKELRGFEKVFLNPGEAKDVEILLNKKYAASFWDEARSSWILEKDTFSVFVGDSSTNTPVEGRFEVQQT
ncbi:hypothetical protein ANO14919_135610 [Xylariales sp. No.14919]|nr:hypothetical protein ANO14919_135610 [Xylariales sp. No.14919]